MDQLTLFPTRRTWNKSRPIGQKSPFKLQEIWAIRTRLQMASKTRDPALFDLAIDSKLRGCDLVSLRVGDVASGDDVHHRATIIQRKTAQPVQFEITNKTRLSVSTWISEAMLSESDYLFATGADHTRPPIHEAILKIG